MQISNDNNNNNNNNIYLPYVAGNQKKIDLITDDYFVLLQPS